VTTAEPSAPAAARGTGRTIAIAAACTVGFAALCAVVLYLITFHLVGAPALFVWLLLLVLLGGAIALGRSPAAGLAGVLGGGIFLAVLFLSGPALMQSYVLAARGETVTAVTTGVVDGNFVTLGGNQYNKGRGDSISTVRGVPLRGVITDDSDHLGTRLTVVADPRGQVDSRLPADVKPVTYTVLGIIGLLISGLVWYVAARTRPGARKRS
jgi:hypothetical protein